MHFSKLLLLTAYAMASVIPRDEPAGKISEILGSPEGQCALGCAAWFDSCYAVSIPLALKHISCI